MEAIKSLLSDFDLAKILPDLEKLLGGMEMLLMQGCRSLEIWTGRTAPVDAMRRALCQ